MIDMVFFLYLHTQRFKKSIRPLNSWRVNNLNAAAQDQHMEPESVEGPHTINLAEADFTAMNWEAISEA